MSDPSSVPLVSTTASTAQDHHYDELEAPAPSIHNQKIQPRVSPWQMRDTEQVASFLLSLKHNRSVTPEPPTMLSSSISSSAVTAGTSEYYYSYSLSPSTALSRSASLPIPASPANPRAVPRTTPGMPTPNSSKRAGAQATKWRKSLTTTPSPAGPDPRRSPKPSQSSTKKRPMSLSPVTLHHQNHAAVACSFSSSFDAEFANEEARVALPPTAPTVTIVPTVTYEGNVDLVDVPALVANSPLVLWDDRELVPDALFVAMAQMTVCQLTDADRVGCYKARPLGFVGMCCRHCGGQPGVGRYFPNSIRSLAQTTTSQTMVKHIGGKCRACPPHIRDAVLELGQVPPPALTAVASSSSPMALFSRGGPDRAGGATSDDEEDEDEEGTLGGSATGHSTTTAASNAPRPRYGSRKVFFQRVWTRLHSGGDAVLSLPTDDTSLPMVAPKNKPLVSSSSARPVTKMVREGPNKTTSKIGVADHDHIDDQNQRVPKHRYTMGSSVPCHATTVTESPSHDGTLTTTTTTTTTNEFADEEEKSTTSSAASTRCSDDFDDREPRSRRPEDRHHPHTTNTTHRYAPSSLSSPYHPHHSHIPTSSSGHSYIPSNRYYTTVPPYYHHPHHHSHQQHHSVAPPPHSHYYVAFNNSRYSTMPSYPSSGGAGSSAMTAAHAATDAKRRKTDVSSALLPTPHSHCDVRLY